MEDPEEIEPSEKKSEMEGYHDFKKNDLSLQIEEKKYGKQTFYVKSEIFFDKVEKAIRSALKQFKFKLKKLFTKKDRKYIERIRKELKDIKNANLAHYFMIVDEVISYANRNGIPKGFGRGCLVGDTLVLTDHGYKKLQDIRIDDKVYTHTGKLDTVINTYQYPIKSENLLEKPIDEKMICKKLKRELPDKKIYHERFRYELDIFIEKDLLKYLNFATEILELTKDIPLRVGHILDDILEWSHHTHISLPPHMFGAPVPSFPAIWISHLLRVATHFIKQ